MPTLDWIGKQAVLNHHEHVPYRQLVRVPEQSHGTPGSGNLLIEGDNLEALRALLPEYEGRVKLIYIDPPYNTGNEGWIYNDNVNSPEMRAWLAKVVGRESEDLSRHDKWLCMMYPRLQLLKRLLRPDGSLWMSLDDNAQHLGRMLMDEVFGAGNFVATVIWQKKYSSANDHKTIAPMHEYVMVYQRGGAWQRNLIPRTEENDKQYKFSDEKGIFRVSDYTCNKTADERPNLFYSVVNPNTGEEIWPKRTRVWSYSREEHEKNVRDNLIYWGKAGRGKVPAFKRYRDSLRGGGGTVPNTWFTHEVAGHTDEAKKEARDILGNVNFDTPKPTRLIQRILQIATNAAGSPGSGGELEPDIVLDSYAGSGTTGHAVLKQNAEDGGHRRFVLVQMADEGTPDAPRPIARPITARRLSYAAQEHGGGFDFLTLGDTLFEADGRIREGVPYDALARYVFHAATGEAWAGTRDGPFLGRTGRGVGVYLLYNGVLKDKHPQGGNVLTREVLAGLPDGAGGGIVYGTASRVTPGRLEALGLSFRQIPYALAARAGGP